VAEREKGTVKWFNRTKGYGFITGDNGREIFVHKNAIRGPLLVKDGDRVEFTVIDGPKGTQADDVIVLYQTSSK
jgi:CspA family cold shock protein